MDDLKVIESCLMGNGNMFSHIIDRYKNMVYDLAYRMCNNYQEAEDISQEAFLRSYQALSRFNPKYKFSTWLYQVTLNIIRDRFKKKKIKSISLDAPINSDKSNYYHQTSDTTHNPEAILANREKEEYIQQAIFSLPLKYREVIVLRHLKDLSYIEISSILKIPTGTVKVRIYRAREQLRDMLKNIE
jgi:RNA polymerase sigma-70 factor (ECF subfamily)